jgi:hypothetical protein
MRDFQHLGWSRYKPGYVEIWCGPLELPTAGTWTPIGFVSVKLTSRYMRRDHSVGVGNIDFRSQGRELRVDRERCETPYRRKGGFRRLRQ